MKRLFTLFIVLVSTLSCIKDDPFLYRVFTFGFPQADGSLLADDGIKYIFPNSAPDWQGSPRVYAVLDVTAEKDGNIREADFLTYSVPLFKEPDLVSTQKELDSLGTLPVKVNDAWYSGGCLNMLNTIKVLPGGGEVHFISLALDPTQEISDTLRLTLHHSCETDFPDTDILEEKNFYSSFPLGKYMPERDSIVLKLNWVWESETHSTTGKVEI